MAQGLEEKYVDEGNDYDSEDDGIQPVKQGVPLFSLLIVLFPEFPLHLLGNVEVEDDNKTKEPPIISEPNNP